MMTTFKPLRIIRTSRDELRIQAERLGLRGKMNLQPDRKSVV